MSNSRVEHTLLFAVGFLVLGALAGILGMRSLLRWAGQFRDGVGTCEACGEKGWLIGCRRCGRHVAMCHYYGILYPDDPQQKIVGKRRNVQLCTDCLPGEVRERLEKL